jgi:hypothetical protein
VTESVQLTIIGGDLDLLTDRSSVTLHRAPGSDSEWTGTLPPVRVVDARGTGEGWTVRWTVTSVALDGVRRASDLPAPTVRLEPGDPVVVAGLPDGLTSGRPGREVPGGRRLFAAAPGTGGGTYEVGGTVVLRLPRSVEASAVTVSFGFSLG